MTSSTDASRAAQLGAARAPRTARCASASVRLARTMRWAMVGSGTRKARAISSVVRPPSSRSVSATRASVGQHRVAGDEDQAQQVVADRRRRAPRRGRRRGSAARSSSRPSSCVLALRAARCGGAGRWRGAWPSAISQAPGLSGTPDSRPLLERGDQRVLRQLLGQADVAHQPGEAGDEPARLDPPDRVERRGVPREPSSTASEHHRRPPRNRGPRPTRGRTPGGSLPRRCRRSARSVSPARSPLPSTAPRPGRS